MADVSREGDEQFAGERDDRGPDQPRWIRAGGPSQTVAVICRHTVWTRRPEPDDLENEGLWCQPFWERRPDVRSAGIKAAVDKWARATDRNATGTIRHRVVR